MAVLIDEEKHAILGNILDLILGYFVSVREAVAAGLHQKFSMHILRLVEKVLLINELCLFQLLIVVRYSIIILSGVVRPDCCFLKTEKAWTIHAGLLNRFTLQWMLI